MRATVGFAPRDFRYSAHLSAIIDQTPESTFGEEALLAVRLSARLAVAPGAANPDSRDPLIVTLI